MAAEEKDEARKAELLEIAATCEAVPENPPKSFREAIQFTWFVQLGGIISENPLALNPGRFDQYIYPYYKADLDAGKIDYDTALELLLYHGIFAMVLWPASFTFPNGLLRRLYEL